MAESPIPDPTAPGRKRSLTAYKFYMKATIKELKKRFPDQTIILPMVSKLCAQTWSSLDENMKKIFQIEANHCEEDRIRRGLDDYDIPGLPSDLDSDSDEEEEGDEGEPQVEMKKDQEKSHGKGMSDFVKEPVKLGRPVTLKTKKAAIQPEPMEDDVPQVVAILPRRPRVQKRRKSKSIPGAPRRPLSAFVWFCKDERWKVRKSNPGLTMGDTSKVLGKMWHGLEPEVKDIYQNKSKEDRLRYSNELEAFKANLKSESASSSESSSQQGSAEAETETKTDSMEIPLEVSLLSIKEEPIDDLEDLDDFGLDMCFGGNEEDMGRMQDIPAGTGGEFEMGELKKEMESVSVDDNLCLRLECDEQLDETSSEEPAKEDE